MAPQNQQSRAPTRPPPASETGQGSTPRGTLNETREQTYRQVQLQGQVVFCSRPSTREDRETESMINDFITSSSERPEDTRYLNAAIVPRAPDHRHTNNLPCLNLTLGCSQPGQVGSRPQDITSRTSTSTEDSASSQVARNTTQVKVEVYWWFKKSLRRVKSIQWLGF